MKVIEVPVKAQYCMGKHYLLKLHKILRRQWEKGII